MDYLVMLIWRFDRVLYWSCSVTYQTNPPSTLLLNCISRSPKEWKSVFWHVKWMHPLLAILSVCLIFHVILQLLFRNWRDSLKTTCLQDIEIHCKALKGKEPLFPWAVIVDTFLTCGICVHMSWYMSSGLYIHRSLVEHSCRGRQFSLDTDLMLNFTSSDHDQGS